MSESSRDIGAAWRQSQDRNRARREAFNDAVAAVRKVSAGRSKDEVCELLAAHLRARGVKPPADLILGHLADRALADAGLISQLRVAVRGLGMLAGAGLQAAGNVRDLFQDGELNLELGDAEPLIIGCDRDRPGAAVLLDPDAQRLLDPHDDLRSRPLPDYSEIFVLLSWAAPGLGSGPVAVRAGDHRVGVLTAADGTAFEPFLEFGAKRGQPVVTEAVLDRSAGTSWRLTVYRPGA